MLTVRRWRWFIWKFITGAILQSVIIFALSIAATFLDKNFSWQTTFVTLKAFLSDHLFLFSHASLIVILGLMICGLYLQITLFALKTQWRVCAGIVIGICLYVRMSFLYPTEPSTPQGFRYLREYSFYWILIVIAVLNFFSILNQLLAQNENLKSFDRSFDLDRTEKESQRLSMHAVAFVMAIVGVVATWGRLSPSFSLSLSRSQTPATRPNIFILALDGVKAEKALTPSKSRVMHFLGKKIAEADFAAPLLPGIPNSFPNWVEVATCKYALRNGVRTSYPTIESRLNGIKQKTLFSEAREQGYATVIVGDGESSFFTRFAFGATEVIAPPDTRRAEIEKQLLSFLPVLKSYLILPRMQRLIPSVLNDKRYSDPRLVAYEFVNSLNKYNSNDVPVFFTAYFSRPMAVVSYDDALNKVDSAIGDLWHELESKGWFHNAVVLIAGDKGESQEHEHTTLKTQEVLGEDGATAPLIIWTSGRTSETSLRSPNIRLARSVDIAPTLTRLVNLNYSVSECDGAPLLSLIDEPPRFSTFAAYQETSEWLEGGPKTPLGQLKINYASWQNLFIENSKISHERFLNPHYLSLVLNSKQRAWVTDKFRLVVQPSLEGAKVQLYNRELDPHGQNDLLNSKNSTVELTSKTVATELLRQLSDYLLSQGVEVLSDENGQIFYVEQPKK